MSEIKIFPVPPAEFIKHWTIVEPLLNKSLEVALQRYLAVDVLALMIQGQGQGWLICEDANILAVMVTKIDQYPRRRGLSIFALAGTRMSEWFQRANEILRKHRTMQASATVWQPGHNIEAANLPGRTPWCQQLALY